MEISIATELNTAVQKAEELRDYLINLHEETAREDYSSFNEESSKKLKELETTIEDISYWLGAIQEIEKPEPIEYRSTYNVSHATCFN